MKVGLVNGCFDGLHAGHKHMLVQAKTRCDKLVVAVNCDADVAKLKGAGRPLYNIGVRRAALLDFLGFDTEIYTFTDPNLEALIKGLHPDFIFKGGDYTREQVRGHQLVESWGGQVIIIPILKGFGTSKPKGGTQPETCRP